ncbi:hypothetical protein HDV05_000105 [Chytridiales sp. JEL 0842]|nr:hypothetical protein HDV05_000105 [Chytridiales sp. JEL 0842]
MATLVNAFDDQKILFLDEYPNFTSSLSHPKSMWKAKANTVEEASEVFHKDPRVTRCNVIVKNGSRPGPRNPQSYNYIRSFVGEAELIKSSDEDQAIKSIVLHSIDPSAVHYMNIITANWLIEILLLIKPSTEILGGCVSEKLDAENLEDRLKAYKNSDVYRKLKIATARTATSYKNGEEVYRQLGSSWHELSFEKQEEALNKIRPYDIDIGALKNLENAQIIRCIVCGNRQVMRLERERVGHNKALFFKEKK